MILRDHTEFDGRRYEVTWQAAGDLPPRELITQVSAVCFSPDDLIVMVSCDGLHWNIPGGHPESGETLEEALRREILEEACCEITVMHLLGWQHVRDLEDGSIHYQMRYCCRVDVGKFRPEYEVSHRKLIPYSMFLDTLSYGGSTIAREIFSLALDALVRKVDE